MGNLTLHHSPSLTGTSLILSLFTIQAQGAGFFLPNQSAEATARGNAWVATADSPAAVYYNPAGLTQLDQRSLEAGVYTIHLGNQANIGGVNYEAKGEWQPIPYLFYAHPVDEDLTLGFRLHSPFGLGTEWRNDTPFRDTTTEADLINIRASAVAGYRVNDQFSLGGGISLNYAKATLTSGLTPFDSDNPSTDFLEFDGDDFAFSWIIGALWQPHPQHSFGLVYRSKADYSLGGSLDATVGFPLIGSASLDIQTPDSAAIGYAYKPTKRLTIEANVEWINWDSLNSLTIATPLGNLPPQNFEWESSFIYAIGMSYQLNDRYTVSLGYDYNESSQPSANYNPAIADANRHWINTGVSYRGDEMTWNLAYQYGFSTRNVTGSNNTGTNGRYEADHHAVVISTRYNF